jgi:hypothetical protein
MAQQKTATEYNRYPEVFKTVQTYARENFGDRPLRILSFGCSYGLEIATIKTYFPDAAVFGCDVNEPALAIAAAITGASIFRSSPEAISAFAPFDIIFAMSVLCRFTHSNTAKTIRDIFPFAEFEGHIAALDKSLRNGGLLCVFNSNYFFSQSQAFANYAPVRSGLIASNGFVDKWLSDGHRISSAVKLPTGREHEIEYVPDFVTDDDFRDVIFRKGAHSPVEIGGAAKPGGAVVFTRDLGPDLEESVKCRRIAGSINEQVVVAADGSTWIGQTWRKSGLRGNVLQLPTWWRTGYPEQVGMFMDAEKPFVVRPAPAGRTRVEKIFPQTKALKQGFQTLLDHWHRQRDTRLK